MGLLNKIFKQKAERHLPLELVKLEEFIFKFSALIDSDKYIAKSDFRPLLTDYDTIYNHFFALKKSGMLNAYCKTNKFDISIVNKFFILFETTDSIIDERNDTYVANKTIEEKKYLDGILKDIDPQILLDDDQRKAVLTDEDYCLIIAGAGAGKTTTVAAKVKYLVDRKGIDPKQILVISFTNKAVKELRDRINNNLKIDCPITTFHSTGNAILRKQSDEVLNIKEESFLYKTVNDYLRQQLLDPKMLDNLMLFFGSYFNSPYSGDDLKAFFNTLILSDTSTLKSNINEFQKDIIDIREKKKITINNEYLRSTQEVRIANFLFMNGIDYDYEATYPYHIFLARKPYTPDFKIVQDNKVVYLEHFGITESGTHKFYSSDELEKYKKAINDKIDLHKTHGTKLIYTFSQYNDGQDYIEHLKTMLINEGIELRPRSNEEVYSKIALSEENKYISKLVALLCRFISNFKTNGYTEDTFYLFMRKNPNVRTKLFLDIALGCYLQYQRRLQEENAVDFQDMINDSARLLREHKAVGEKLDFKYIIVDEYQDISRQRFDLTKELSDVTNAKIVAVGDDWQSIYAFSGSDISLFTQFCKKMGYGKELKITKTYRNSQEVIDIAGDFVQKNESQIKKTLLANKHIIDPVIIYSFDDKAKKYSPENNYEARGALYMLANGIQTALTHIIDNNNGNQNKNILLIGRYGFDGQQLEKSNLFEYQDYGNKIICKKYPKLKIQFMTAHSSKGLGYDDVIIINTSNSTFGFPCKIDDDPVLKLVTHEDNSIQFAEERRLFYVAMTRTKNRVYMITPENKPSEFVLELIKNYKNIVLDGELKESETQLLSNKLCPICGYPLKYRMNNTYGLKLYMCTNEPEICNFISNDLHGGIMSIQKCDKCQDGYLIVKQKKDGGAILGCTNYTPDKKGCNNVVDSINYEKEYLNNKCETLEIEIADESNPEKDKSVPKKKVPEAIKEDDSLQTALNYKESAASCFDHSKTNSNEIAFNTTSLHLNLKGVWLCDQENQNIENILLELKNKFNKVELQYRNEIIGIGEAGMHLIAYVTLCDGKVCIKFKNGFITELNCDYTTLYPKVIENINYYLDNQENFIVDQSKSKLASNADFDFEKEKGIYLNLLDRCKNDVQIKDDLELNKFLKYRTYHCLMQYGIVVWKDLACASIDEICKFRNFGKACFRDLVSFLAKMANDNGLLLLLNKQNNLQTSIINTFELEKNIDENAITKMFHNDNSQQFECIFDEMVKFLEYTIKYRETSEYKSEIYLQRLNFDKKEIKTLQTIGEIYSISRERVRQICQNMEKKLFAKLKKSESQLKKWELLNNLGKDNIVAFSYYCYIKTNNFAFDTILNTFLDFPQLKQIKYAQDIVGPTNTQDQENASSQTNNAYANSNNVKQLNQGDLKTVLINGYNFICDKNGEIITDEVLFEKLRKLRYDLSVDENLPAYCIISNLALVGLATYKPKTYDEWVAIKGLRDRTYNKYGELFIKAIMEYKN